MQKSFSEIWPELWAKFSLFRLNLIWEYVKKIEEKNFPFDDFIYSPKKNEVLNPEEMLKQIFTHYGLNCKFTLTAVDELSKITNGSSVAANIEIPEKIPDPDSNEFRFFIFKVNLLRSNLTIGPETLSLILGHEVAHAYLHSYRVSGFETELMTDICAVYAGFAPAYALHNKINEVDLKQAGGAFFSEQLKNATTGGSEYMSRWEFWFVEKFLLISRTKKQVKSILKIFNL